MPRVFIPPLLKPLTGGQEEVEVAGTNVRRVIENLDRQYPGIQDRLCENGLLKPGLAVAVDGHVRSKGLLQPVEEASEIHFLPAIGGG